MFGPDLSFVAPRRGLPSFRIARQNDDFQAANDFLEGVFLAVVISIPLVAAAFFFFAH